MTGNIFTKPTKAFEKAIDEPSLAKALIIVIVTGILLGLGVFVYTGDLLQIAYSVILNVILFLVLAVLMWLASFMLIKRTHRSRDKAFSEVASAVGALWVMVLVASLLSDVAFLFIVTDLIIIAGIFGAILIVLGVLFVVYLLVLMKTLLETSYKKAIIPWIIIMILDAVLVTTIGLIIALIL